MSALIAHAMWRASLMLRPGTARSLARAREIARTPAADAPAAQWELVTAVVRSAGAAPGYRDRLAAAGIDPRTPLTREQFARIPVLTRADVRSLGETLCTRPAASLTRNASGGSTGEPVVIWQDQAYTHALLGAKYFFYELMGLHYADPCVLLWGSERDILAGAETATARLKNWLLDRAFINAFRLTASDVTAFCRAVGDDRATWVLAYVQSARELARMIECDGTLRARPRAVVCSAGVLDEATASLIARVFDCRVFNRYGSREVGDMAGTCAEHGRLHLLPHMHYIELLDERDRPVPPGQPGRVVVTSLTNHAMPLVRYDLGDLAVASVDPCACGRSLPTWDRVLGRQVDVFRLADGALVDGEYFAHLFYTRPYCRQFQIIQRASTSFEVRIATDTPADVEADAERLRRDCLAVLGPSSQLDILAVASIETSASGKVRAFMTEAQ